MAIPNQSDQGNFSRQNTDYEGSNRGRLTLNLGKHIHVPILSPSPSEEETQAEGRMLFEDFVMTQVQREGLDHQYTQISVPVAQSGYRHRARQSDIDLVDETDSLREDGLFDGFPVGYKNPMWAKAGRDLRQLADKFAKSEERKMVKEKASQVNIQGITMEQFQDLLCELFRDGIVRRERIVTLFFFCTDVMIRAIRERIMNQVHLLFRWSLNFITERVCRWVQEQGGWGVVLGTYVPKFAFTVCALTVTAAAAFFIWKNW